MATTNQQYYSSKFITKEFNSTTLFGKDTVDTSCTFEQTKCVKFESKSNGQSFFESTRQREFTNGKEIKSFIQQRVERLYGPGALAQGFFVSRRQKNRNSESDAHLEVPKDNDNKHSKSLNDKLIDMDLSDDNIGMKQSTSSPTLPVFRHLTPQFRAQLPAISSRKVTDSPTHSMQKSNTVPTNINEANVNSDDMKVNGDVKLNGDIVKVNGDVAKVNGLSIIESGVVDFVKQVPVVKNDLVRKNTDQVVKDGHYFLKILEDECDRLLRLAANVEKDLETTDGLTEDVIGKLRSTSGKARLLVSQKLQQFKGLCTNNITQNDGAQFPTTNEDLQGFWDMVMIQVDQVNSLFKDIDELKRNNWIEEQKEIKPIPSNTGSRRIINIKPNAKVLKASEEIRKQRDAERKKLIEERKAAAKAAKAQCGEDVKIFVPES